MSNILITQLLHLLDEAFQGKDGESLLSNLASFTEDDWHWVAPGGVRSICEIVAHVGSCKFIYQNKAFDDEKLTWEDTLRLGGDALVNCSTAQEWLSKGHQVLVQSITALDDSQLLDLRLHHTGRLVETRWIIQAMIQHDLYHAGEINFIRALHQHNDE